MEGLELELPSANGRALPDGGVSAKFPALESLLSARFQIFKKCFWACCTTSPHPLPPPFFFLLYSLFFFLRLLKRDWTNKYIHGQLLCVNLQDKHQQHTACFFIDSTQNYDMLMSSNTSYFKMVLVSCNACGFIIWDDFFLVGVLITGVFVFFNTHTDVVFEKEDPQKVDTDFCVH